MTRWGPLIAKLIFSKHDQVDTLKILHDYYTENRSQLKVFAQICRILYEMDIIEEEALIEWYYSPSTTSAAESSTTTKNDPIREQVYNNSL